MKILLLTETYWRPIGDLSETQRRPIGDRSICLIRDRSETNMPDRRPTCFTVIDFKNSQNNFLVFHIFFVESFKYISSISCSPRALDQSKMIIFRNRKLSGSDKGSIEIRHTVPLALDHGLPK